MRGVPSARRAAASSSTAARLLDVVGEAAEEEPVDGVAQLGEQARSGGPAVDHDAVGPGRASRAARAARGQPSRCARPARARARRSPTPARSATITGPSGAPSRSARSCATVAVGGIRRHLAAPSRRCTARDGGRCAARRRSCARRPRRSRRRAGAARRGRPRRRRTPTSASSAALTSPVYGAGVLGGDVLRADDRRGVPGERLERAAASAR